MDNLIKELNSLILKPKKGSSGYTQLKSSEQVTAHKIDRIINKRKKETKLKITKFGFIHESEGGAIVLSDFELEGDSSGDVYVNTVDAIIAYLERVKLKHIKEASNDIQKGKG